MPWHAVPSSQHSVLLRDIIVEANSGWNEVEGPALGDFADLHNYVPRRAMSRDMRRAYCCHLHIHSSVAKEDNSSIFGPLAMSFQNFAEWGYNVAGQAVGRSVSGQGVLDAELQTCRRTGRKNRRMHASAIRWAQTGGVTISEL